MELVDRKDKKRSQKNKVKTDKKSHNIMDYLEDHVIEETCRGVGLDNQSTTDLKTWRYLGEAGDNGNDSEDYEGMPIEYEKKEVPKAKRPVHKPVPMYLSTSTPDSNTMNKPQAVYPHQPNSSVI